jgi:elongation factor Ts
VGEISAKTVKTLRDQTGAGMMDCKRALADAAGDAKKAVELLRERGLAKASKRDGRATTEGAIAIELRGGAGGMVELGCETDFVARTDDFEALARALAAKVAEDPAAADREALLDAEIGGEKGRDRIGAAIAKLGENVVLKRVARLAVDGAGLVGGYVHGPGKLGVLVALETDASGAELEALARDLAMHVAAADPTPVAVDRDGVPAELIESERSIFRKQAEQSGKPEKVLDRIVEGRMGKFLSEVALLEQPFVKDAERSVGELLEAVGSKLGAAVRVAGFQRFRLGEASEA